jgi:hypothetical protein
VSKDEGRGSYAVHDVQAEKVAVVLEHELENVERRIARC